MTKHVKNPLQRLIAMLLCVVMVVGFMPVATRAAEDDGSVLAPLADGEDAVRLPITIRDAYADNILFNSNHNPTQLDTNSGLSTAIAGTQGLVELELGTNGLPVYTEDAIRAYADLFVLDADKKTVINPKTGFDWDNDSTTKNTAIVNSDLERVLYSLMTQSGFDADTTAATYTKVDNLNEATSSLAIAEWMLTHLFDDGKYTNMSNNPTDYTKTYDGYESLVLTKGNATAGASKIYGKDGVLIETFDKDFYFYDALKPTIFHGNNGNLADTKEIANGGNVEVTNGGWYPLDGAPKFTEDATKIYTKIEDSDALGLGEEFVSGSAVTVNEKNRYYEHNYHHTTVGSGQFIYHSIDDLFFQFDGDDDVFLFINDVLVIDLGGTHNSATANIWLETKAGSGQIVAALDEERLAVAKDSNGDGVTSWAEYLGLEEGGIYSFDFFQMERCMNASNFAMYTNIKVMDPSAVPGKTAYLGNDRLAYGTTVMENAEISYSFSLTNKSEEARMAVSNMVFTDALLGVSISKDNIELGRYTAPGAGFGGQSIARQVTDLEYRRYRDGETATAFTSIANEAELKKLLEDGVQAGYVFEIRGFKYNVGTPENGRVLKTIDNTVQVKVDGMSNNSEEPRVIEGNASMRLSVAAVQDKTFVIDYAKDLTISNSDLFGKDDQHELTILGQDTTDADGNPIANTVGAVTLSKSSGAYGTMTMSGDSDTTYALTYKPTKFISGVDTFTLNIPVTSNSITNTLQKDVNIIPANNIYYEDDFTTVTDPEDTNAGRVGIEYSGKWSVETENSSGGNTESAEGQVGDVDGVHGWQESLADDTGYSDGSGHYADASVDSAATATFTFTGTGVDIYSRTNGKTGTVIATLKGKSDDGISVSKGIIVDNLAESGDYFQIPTLSFHSYKSNGEEVALPYGTYTVTIKVTTGADDDGDKVCDRFIYYLDGIRVYNPMKDQSGYAPEERNAIFKEVRDILLDVNSFGEVTEGETSVAGAVFIDSVHNDQAVDGTAADTPTTTTNVVGIYEDYGPKNEVYLKAGQSITFQVNPEGQYYYIGLKAPNIDGTGDAEAGYAGSATALVSNGQDNEGKEVNRKIEINHSTDLYYKVVPDAEGYIVIKNTGEGLLSVTKLRVTGETTEGAQVLSITEEEALEAVKLFSARPVVDTEEEPVDPNAPVEPEQPDVEIDNPTEPEQPGADSPAAALLRKMLKRLFTSLSGWFN